MAINVLYIDGVGPFGGASRSLFEAVRMLSQSDVRPHFVAAEGTALDVYRTVATDVIATRGLSRFDNTQYSHYRGVRWLVLLRELFHAPFTWRAMHEARRKWNDIDVIHVNEVTEIIPGLLAKRLFNVPMVVHVRSPQARNTNTCRSRWIYNVLAHKADAIIAINETTRATMPASLNVDVIQNSFTAKVEVPVDPVMQGNLDKLRPTSLKVGFVGNVHVSKGIFDLVDAMHLARQQGHDVELVVVGGNASPARGLKGWLLERAGLNQNVYEELVARIGALGLQDSVHLMGATKDIQRVYARLDVLAFPSHFDAPGRPVFEAGFFGVPSIVCVRHPAPDTLVPGETGLTAPACDPEGLAKAIVHFATQRDEVKRMGANAQLLAERNCDPANNAKKIRAVYARVMEKRKT
ncbi:glycosyltransferase family 4 protein [Pandoraea sp. CB10b_02]|uniref:glycosyltransferase family 4 protein n=1 Tax=Pandoraea sp. CB10b_02 TaxID=2014535 RepID=UPI002579AC95|nr:glycosyltransferase family 4 protein [Pandoraea sp. CB10b_02]